MGEATLGGLGRCLLLTLARPDYLDSLSAATAFWGRVSWFDKARLTLTPKAITLVLRPDQLPDLSGDTWGYVLTHRGLDSVSDAIEDDHRRASVLAGMTSSRRDTLKSSLLSGGNRLPGHLVRDRMGDDTEMTVLALPLEEP